MNATIAWTDFVTLIGVVAAIAGGLWRGWAMIQAVRDEIYETQAHLAELRLEMARGYVTTGALSSVEARWTDALDRINDKLDRLIERGQIST